MDLPVWTAPIDENFTDNHPVEYLNDSREQIDHAMPGNNGALSSGCTDSYFMDDQMATESENPDNFGSLSIITNNSASTWRMHCKLYITFPTKTVVGSGTIIGPRLVLTAGHCVYDFATHQWATSVKVVPAYNNGSTPYGYTYSYSLHTWTAWMYNQNFDYDIAVIKTQYNIGNSTGWLGYGYNTNNTFFTTNLFNNPGYPAASPYNGQYLYWSSGKFDQALTNRVYFNRISYGGQSGSSTYYFTGLSKIAYAVVSHVYSSPAKTGCTRITSQVYNWMVGLANSAKNVVEEPISDALSVTLYPNPVTDNISISLKGEHDDGLIRVYDILGNLVAETAFESDATFKNIDVSNMKPGCYVMAFSDGSHSLRQNFIRSGR